MCDSPECTDSKTNTTLEETRSSACVSEAFSPSESQTSEPDRPQDSAELCDPDVVVVYETSLVPVVEVDWAHPGSLFKGPCKDLDVAQLKEDLEHQESHPGEADCSGTVVGSSPVSYFRSVGPKVIRCFQPPLVQTQTVTITAESDLSSGISTTEVPIVQTHSVTYESSKVTVDGTDEDKEGSSESSSKTVTSESTSGTTVTTTTTHISKVVKSGSSETRVEKRIVITAEADIEQDKGKGSGASAL